MSTKAGRVATNRLLARLRHFAGILVAIANLFPAVGFDGGPMTIAVVEAIVRRPLSARARERILLGGTAVLLAASLQVIVNDLGRISWLFPLGHAQVDPTYAATNERLELAYAYAAYTVASARRVALISVLSRSNTTAERDPTCPRQRGTEMRHVIAGRYIPH